MSVDRAIRAFDEGGEKMEMVVNDVDVDVDGGRRDSNQSEDVDGGWLPRSLVSLCGGGCIIVDPAKLHQATGCIFTAANPNATSAAPRHRL